MVISYNSQLGLRFKDPLVKDSFLQLMKSDSERKLGISEQELKKLRKVLSFFDEAIDAGEGEIELPDEIRDIYNEYQIKPPEGNENNIVRGIVSETLGLDINLIDDEGSTYYFICDSVYKAAELIKINENFSGRTIKDIKFGKYTYLMGKHSMVRFVCVRGALRGFYYNDKENKCFDFGIEMEDGRYFFEPGFEKEFSMIMQVLAFVELGDIEVKMLEAGRNNGGKKNIDKVTNTSKNTVYVVDSTWNKILIRTDGFAVRGHFRLQPCGEGHKDRKLIWVDAFEKHGYKRKPSGVIVHQ